MHQIARAVVGHARTAMVGLVVVAVIAAGLSPVAVLLSSAPAGAAAATSVTIPPVTSPTADSTGVTPYQVGATAKPKGFDSTTPYSPAGATELVGERTERDKFFLNPDGSRTAELSSVPLHYKDSAGNWTDIDTRIVADDAHPGSFRSAANAWTVRFAPLSAATGIEYTTADGVMTLVPVGAGAVTPVLGPAPNQVTYPGAWKNADLRYTVRPDGVEEDIVLNGPSDRTQFAFSSTGASFTADPNTPGGVSPVATAQKPTGHSGQFTPPVVHAADGRPVVAAKATLTASAGAAAGMSVSVDPGWAAGLSATDYPVTIDPTWAAGPTFEGSYKNDGTSCSYCGIQIGDPYDTGWTDWRSIAYFDYTSLMGKQITASSVLLQTLTGTATAYPIYACPASTSWSFDGACPGGYVAAGTATDSAWWGASPMDNLFDGWTRGSPPNVGAPTNTAGSLGFEGYEQPFLYTYKSFASATLFLAYDQPPPTPAPVSPAANTVATTTNLSFAGGTVTDPDGDPVTYQFSVATGSDALTGTVAQSVWQSTPNWTPPSGTFTDGGTYYWSVRAEDNLWYTTPSAWSTPQKFRIDYGLGQRPNEPYDALGASSVNLSNGNLNLTRGDRVSTRSAARSV